jgi:serine/threonine-protein kinase HipA
MTVPLYFEDVPIGEISVGSTGPSFTYAPSWAQTPQAFPLSLLMPIEGGAFDPEIVLPWVMNLLPENPHLAVVGRWLGVAPQDAIGLLEKIGRDVAGAVSVGQPRSQEGPDHRRVGSEADLERMIEDLPGRPFLAGEEGVAMSLAGAQEKLPVAIVDGAIAIPLGGAPSTHILKPDNRHLYGSVQNEALCLVLARRCGLRVAKATTGKANDRSYLLVERYDRIRREGICRRIHQEDFCQALGKPPAAKYERNQSGIKGPRLADMFEVVRTHMTAADTLRLLDAAIFNVLVCNTDAHAKNYSILFHGRRAELAPLYDLMCGAAWDGITRNLAQTIGDKNRGDHIHARHWRRMAEACGLRGVAVLRRVDALSRKVSAEIDAASDDVRSMPTGDHPMLPHFADAIRRRCTTVRANLETDAEEGADDQVSEGPTTEQA